MVANYLPQGKPVDYEIADQSTIRITVAGSEEQETTVMLNDTQLLQPLIRFCLENNVMLPREGRKSIVIVGQSVSLCIELALDILMMRGAAPTSFGALIAAVQ